MLAYLVRLAQRSKKAIEGDFLGRKRMQTIGGLEFEPKSENVQLTHRQFAHPVRKFPICILANDIEVPMNVGSLFRIADAMGVENIYLCGKSPTPPNSKIKKTSRSTEKRVPYFYRENALDVVQELKARGYLIVSLELTSASIDIRRFSLRPDQRVCLVLGSENEGVSQALLDASDCTVHIPMFGTNSSMNVATACSIALFEIIRTYMP
jgi:tRNA G18 (ribose-2'-O)-methylase SpoU